MSNTVSDMFGHGSLQGALVLSSSPRLVTDDYVGIEVEVEGVYDEAQRTIEPHWNNIEDGSLRNGGREFVFKQPMFGQDVLNALDSLQEELSTIDYNYSDRCSVHVHLNVRDMTFEQIANMTTMYALAEPLFYAKVEDARESNFYCKPLNGSYDYLNALNTMFFPAEEEATRVSPISYVELPQGTDFNPNDHILKYTTNGFGNIDESIWYIRVNVEGIPYYGQERVEPEWTLSGRLGYAEAMQRWVFTTRMRAGVEGVMTRSDASHITTPSRSQYHNFRNQVMDGMKYYAYNVRPIQNLGTIEFRHHHGTHDPEKLLDWVNTILCIKRYVMDIDHVFNAQEINEWVENDLVETILADVFSQVSIPQGSLRLCAMRASKVAKVVTMSDTKQMIEPFRDLTGDEVRGLVDDLSDSEYFVGNSTIQQVRNPDNFGESYNIILDREVA